MSMPLGLDLKSLIVGVLFAMFGLPWIMGMLNRGKGGGTSTQSPSV